MYFRVYIDSDTRWRWALYSGQNEQVAISPVSYPNIEDAGRGIGLVMAADSMTAVVEPEGDASHHSGPNDGRALQ